MVKALLAGTKTQTRRVVKPQPEPMPGGGVRWPKHGHSGPDEYLRDVAARMWCPYAQPGDRLWVRETFLWTKPENCWPAGLHYRADKPGVIELNGNPLCWRPSIHMPRRASRITLEITAVRVERLQEISNDDAVAEGITLHPDHHGKPRESLYGPVRTYRDLWEQINGPGSWDANPWVWVLQFRRLGVE